MLKRFVFFFHHADMRNKEIDVIHLMTLYLVLRFYGIQSLLWNANLA